MNRRQRSHSLSDVKIENEKITALFASFDYIKPKELFSFLKEKGAKCIACVKKPLIDSRPFPIKQTSYKQ